MDNFNSNDYNSNTNYYNQTNNYSPNTYSTNDTYRSYNDPHPDYESEFNNFDNYYNGAKPSWVRSVSIPNVLAKSFIFMFFGLLVTAFAATTTSEQMLYSMLQDGTFQALFIIQLIITFVGNFAVNKNMPIFAGVLYVIYTYLTGITFSIFFAIFTTASIVSVFLITAGLFGTMAVIGIVTKKDLSSVGSLCTMGLLGIIVTSIVNIVFLGSTGVDNLVCVVGVLIFIGLTAYDTQKIKERAMTSMDETSELSLALFGAFELYLDFINIFIKLLSLFGKSRD